MNLSEENLLRLRIMLRSFGDSQLCLLQNAVRSASSSRVNSVASDLVAAAGRGGLALVEQRHPRELEELQLFGYFAATRFRGDFPQPEGDQERHLGTLDRWIDELPARLPD